MIRPVDDTDPISRAELVEMFGTDMPVEAVQALWGADDGRTVGQVRAEIRRLGALRRREREEAEAIREIETGWFKRLHEVHNALQADEPVHVCNRLIAALRAYEVEHHAVVLALRRRLEMPTDDMVPPAEVSP